MRRYKYIDCTLLCLAALSSSVCSASAVDLAFAGTPVKQVSIDGTWKKINSHETDPGKGVAYFAETSPDELGVFVADAKLTDACQRVLIGVPGLLSQQQVSELGARDNPWILRYCAERGKPELLKVNKKTFLVDSFMQEERLRVATPQGAMCIPAAKYESHAFTVVGGKLIHIYMIRNMRSEPTANFLPAVSTKLKNVLGTMVWE